MKKHILIGMNWEKNFIPSKLIIILLVILPILVLLVWLYLFANNFSCPGPQDCFIVINLLTILGIFLKISPLIYIYLIIVLILYLKQRSKKFFP